jgi:hypothetical protein
LSELSRSSFRASVAGAIPARTPVPSTRTEIQASTRQSGASEKSGERRMMWRASGPGSVFTIIQLSAPATMASTRLSVLALGPAW